MPDFDFETFVSNIGGFFGIIIDLFVASLFLFFTTILAVSSLVCLALDRPTFAMLFGIALLAITLTARGHCWYSLLVNPKTMDLIVATEVAYLVFIKQGFNIFNCFVVTSSVAMVYLLPYR